MPTPLDANKFNEDMTSVNSAAQQISDAITRVLACFKSPPWQSSAIDQQMQDFVSWCRSANNSLNELPYEQARMYSVITGTNPRPPHGRTAY